MPSLYTTGHQIKLEFKVKRERETYIVQPCNHHALMTHYPKHHHRQNSISKAFNSTSVVRLNPASFTAYHSMFIHTHNNRNLPFHNKLKKIVSFFFQNRKMELKILVLLIVFYINEENRFDCMIIIKMNRNKALTSKLQSLEASK